MKRRILLLISCLALLVFAALLFFLLRPAPQTTRNAPLADSPAPTTAPESAAQEPQELYKGTISTVASRFTVKVPNGWSASVSTSSRFTAIMFARPNQLETLVYQPDVTPAIDENGIPSWNGLTEHFFVLLPTAERRFDPTAHREISSAPFTFEDGTIGIKYDVIKQAAEARQWGGLQKDTQWQGRTYIYEKNGQQLEAHLALYPSSSVDIAFYENVARTIRILE